MKKVALITVRKGSERLKDKNLLKLGNKTILEFAIERALHSMLFDEIWVNSDDLKYKQYTNKYNKVNHYLRPEALGASSVAIDDVIFDFMCNIKSDITVLINTPSPLQPGNEVKFIVESFINSNADSFMTVENIIGHCFYNNTPLGFSTNIPLTRTQDLQPVQRCVYAVMGWKTNIFMESYKKNGYGLFCGQNIKIPVCKESSILLKTEEDFNFIKRYINGL